MSSLRARAVCAAFSTALLLSVFAFAGSANAYTFEKFGDDLTGDPAAGGSGNRVVPVRNASGFESGGAGANGILTSITVETSGGAGTLQISLMRKSFVSDPSIEFLRFADNIAVPVTSDASVTGHQTTVATRVPILQGDRLALELTDSAIYAFHSFESIYNLCAFRSLGMGHDVGQKYFYNTPGCGAQWPAVQGVVEQDADGDQFGDVSQDLCPTDATRQTACATTPPTLPANLVITVAKSTAKAGATATRSFTVKNIGGTAATPVTFALTSSKKIKRVAFLKGCPEAKNGKRCGIKTLEPGRSTTIKVRVTPKGSASTRITAKVNTPGEAAITDNSASTTVKFKLKK